MLNSISIKRLFGLYSYDLNFTNKETVPVKFITGPNGYGKTTILTLVYALYNCDFELFMQVPFGSLTFYWDHETVEIRQGRIYRAEESGSDEEQLDGVKLSVWFKKCSDNTLIEQFEITKGDSPEKKEVGQNLKLYLKALPCYYIKDQRLLHKEASVDSIVKSQPASVSAAMNNAEHLKRKLIEEYSLLNEGLQLSKLVIKDAVGEVEYNERKNKLQAGIESLHKYGLIEELVINEYDPANAVFLNAFLNAVEKAIERSRPFVALLDVFSGIVDKSQFANKKMQIHPKFGYRFIVEDEVSSILSPIHLSSGEQHILIQTYEFLFKAQDDSLVLIDEPELSFHLIWQMDYLSNLKAMAELRKIQCIVSTHSPQVFSNDWNLSVDLFTLTQNEKK